MLNWAVCRPDIVHAHDWPTAPVAFGDLGGHCRSIFTIHNLNYGADLIGRAMLAAAAGTTVSPTYAAEVRLSALCAVWPQSAPIPCTANWHATSQGPGRCSVGHTFAFAKQLGESRLVWW